MLQSGTKFELQEHSSYRGDLASWSEEARINEFAHTGNPEYLTPTLAHRMGLSPELMQEVPGVSPSDIEIATTRQRISDSEYDQFEQDYLSRYGLDNVTLEKIKSESEGVYLSHLMEQVSRTVSSDNSERQDDDRNATEVARTFLIEFITEKPEAVDALFAGLRLKGIEAIRDVQVLLEVFSPLHTKFIALSNTRGLDRNEQAIGKQIAVALNYITRGIKNILDDKNVSDNTNYLAYSRLLNFEIERKRIVSETPDNYELGVADTFVELEHNANFDRDTIIPFEIQDGVMAIFGVDKNVLYVLTDKELSEEVKKSVERIVPRIEYSVKDQYFTRRIVAKWPFDLEEVANSVLDVGKQFGRDLYTEFGSEQLRDYVYLMQADMRETIEHDFGFQIKELSIPEQFHFLNYLKHTTVASAETMKLFVGEYGTSALRTFLSLEQEGKKFGDEIVAFGKNNKEAKEVFLYYGKLLDAAHEAKALVREKVDCVHNDCNGYIGQLEKNILFQAHLALTNAVRAKDAHHLAEQLRQYSVDARMYVSLLKTAGIEKMLESPLEEVNATQLSDYDRNRMKELLAENYAKEPNEVFRALVSESLDDHLDDSNTNFNVLKERGKIVSFNRFDTVIDEQNNRTLLYFGSFNADPRYSGVGSLMLETTIKQKIEMCDAMYAHCDPEAKITRKYIEDGFAATKNVRVGGKPSFEIWRSKDSLQHFKSKQMSVETLLRIPSTDTTVVIVEKADDGTFPLLDEGYALTRYFTAGSKTYVAFEKPDTELVAQFTPPHQ